MMQDEEAGIHGAGNEVHDGESPDHHDVTFADKEIGVAGHRQGGGYFYRRDRVLATRQDEDKVMFEIDRRYSKKKRKTAGNLGAKPKPIFAGSNIVAVPVDESRLDKFLVPGLISDLRSVERSGGPLGVAPDHVLLLGSHPDPFPATAPRKAAGTFAVLSQPESLPGYGVNVAIFDSGVDLNHKVLKDHFGPGTGPGDAEDPTPPGTTLGRYSGHGTFVAGLVLQQAPGATLFVRKAFKKDGLLSDSELAALLDKRMPEGVHIVNLSLGGPTHDNIGLPGTEDALRRLHQKDPRIVVVASAGNDGVGVPYFPAAFNDVIGVAAVNAAKKRACFSNYGEWVDACAEGVGITSTFIQGQDMQVNSVPPRPDCPDQGPPVQATFAGFARWSGTSFAAPLVAGAIAAEMTGDPNLDAAAAAFRLLSGKQFEWDGPRKLGVFVGNSSLAFT